MFQRGFWGFYLSDQSMFQRAFLGLLFEWSVHVLKGRLRLLFGGN